MRKVVDTNKFRKGYKRVFSYPSFDLKVFNHVINFLANDIPLEEKYKDHKTVGDKQGCGDCHIAPDIVLIYKKTDDKLYLYLLDIGKHNNVF